jgi:hypothetical protein
MPKIDSPHEHRHFFPRYFAGSGIVIGPGEAVFLQPFHPQTKSIPIPVDDFQDRLLAIRKKKEIPGSITPQQSCEV